MSNSNLQFLCVCVYIHIYIYILQLEIIPQYINVFSFLIIKRIPMFTGYSWHHQDMDAHSEGRGVEVWLNGSGLKFRETEESMPTMFASSENDNMFDCSETGESFSCPWACKGCDWKRNDEAIQDISWKRKLVLNDGYPLCQMPKSGCEDPRWEQKDDLYYPSQSRRLDLPLWAFTSPDDLSDPSSMGRSSQTKPAPVRGTRGMMLPVIRINACVVKAHGSFVSESRVKVRGKEKISSRSSRPYSTTYDTKRSSEDGPLKSGHERDSQDSSNKSASLSMPKDRLCKVDELRLHSGDWHFLDGAGHEQGPLSFSELQVMADQGVIPKNSSVFRKRDKIWVPVTIPSELSEISGHENSTTSLSETSVALLSGSQRLPSSFHGLHPQFIGYTRGRLHELVMKSYKSREFAAAINEVLDPWISARQPKKEIEQHYHSGINIVLNLTCHVLFPF